jgi:ABC-type antimicrobial peptide transport system permease subunit
MSTFEAYLKIGFQHIADITAYDHILFIIALCAIYKVNQWRHILVLVTAFTIGHSVTLVLSTLNYILVPSAIIEFLIPVTILLTAIFNIVRREGEISPLNMRVNYGLALFFGLIHGMGFSNYLKELLGKEESIIQPLLAFNIGLELGQLMIVAIILTFSMIFLNGLSVKHREWNLFVSGAAAGIAFILMTETKFW